MDFANIPDFLLEHELKTPDDDYITLSDMITDLTPDDIVTADYVIDEDSLGNFNLYSFHAWTQTDLLVLLKTAHGSVLTKYPRNP